MQCLSLVTCQVIAAQQEGQTIRSDSRASDSSRPSTSSTSKIGGEVEVPVRLARKGCASLPSFRPLASACALDQRFKHSGRPLRRGCEQIAQAERLLCRLRRGFVLAFSSSARGRTANRKAAPVFQVDQSLGPFLQAGHGLAQLCLAVRIELRQHFSAAFSMRQEVNEFLHQFCIRRVPDVVAVEVFQLGKVKPRQATCQSIRVRTNRPAAVSRKSRHHHGSSPAGRDSCAAPPADSPWRDRPRHRAHRGASKA